MSLKKYYTAKEVIKCTGVDYRQLDYWIRKGIINASGRSAKGKGNPRLFTFNDILEIRVVKGMLNHGLKLNALKACLCYLRKYFNDSNKSLLTAHRFITDGKNVFRYISNEDKLESLNEFGQFAFSFGIDDYLSDVVTKINQLDSQSRYQFRVNQKKAV